MTRILIVFLFCCFNGFAQIINVETMRKSSDSAKWSGSIGLNVELIKNTSDIFNISNKAHLQFNNKKNLWLLINDLSFQKIEGNSFVNKGSQHFRYNRRLSPRFKFEAFVQAQYDAISEIDLRSLVGLGPRFKLSQNDNYRFYLGILVMYEYEKASNTIEDRIQKDVRGSSYLSFSLFPSENLTIISTSYYQPKLEQLKDYRLSSDTSLLIKIFKKLAFKSTFMYNFDNFPVEGIPRTQYEFTNGLLYEFY